jgi:hypothetical protein
LDQHTAGVINHGHITINTGKSYEQRQFVCAFDVKDKVDTSTINNEQAMIKTYKPQRGLSGENTVLQIAHQLKENSVHATAMNKSVV